MPDWVWSVRDLLERMAFRFNNRDNPYLFRDTILAICASERLTYEELITK